VPFGALPLIGVERSGGMKQSYLGDGGWVEACRSTWGKDGKIGEKMGKACRIDFASKKHWVILLKSLARGWWKEKIAENYGVYNPNVSHTVNARIEEHS
jgi:hypothetical protein